MGTEVTSPIAPLDLAAEREALGPALEEAVLRVLRSGQYVLGPEVAAFERDFAQLHCATHGIGVASGTDALIVGLRALGVGPGDRVLTSPFTFFASAGCIAWVGARPVLCDVELETGLLDPGAAASAMEGVRCVLPVHIYGQLVDVRALRRLADTAGATLFEDAAQAHGASRDGLRAGELGDLAAFSFYPTKNLGCAGEGGCLVTNRDDVAARLLRLRDHGSQTKYVHDELGTNTRLAALQAAVLNVKLPHLAAWNERRREIAARYDSALGSSPRLAPIVRRADSEPVYHQYGVRVVEADRDAVQGRLSAAGVFAAVHYPRPVHLQPAAAEWGYGPGSLPNAEALCAQILCLPVHPFLSDADVDRVAETLLGAVEA